MPLEAAGRDIARAEPRLDWFFLARGPALQADLARLGLDSPDPTPELTIARGWPESLACLYVINGAQLGSAMLERRISASLPEAPVSFFATRLSGEDRGWPAFRRFLDQQRLSEAETERAIACGRGIFRALAARLPAQETVATDPAG